MIEAAIFDWGGTLTTLNASTDLEDMWRAAARHLDPGRQDEIAEVLTAVEARSWERVTTDRTSTTLARLLAEATAELGLDVTAAVLEEAEAHHLDAWTPHIVHDPDALPTLTALRERGLRIGLLSNTHWPREFHEHFLERDGLDGLIEARLYTCELAHIKPHPAAFAAVMAALDIRDPARAVYVGDRLYDDVFGARSVGMGAVWRRNRATPGYDIEPDGVIDALPELLPLVDAWLERPSWV
jgi:putative hydrolase of the HAD superfamily